MEYRTIEVKVICAKDLKNVNMFTKMDVYVKFSISSDPRSVKKSPVHKKGGSDPVWNHRFNFNIKESEAKSNRVGLVFRIVSKRTLGDKDIGRVYVPMKELYDNMITGKDNPGEISDQDRFMTYRVQTKSGKFKGSLDFSYKFGEKFVNRTVEPVMAYPFFSGSGPGQSSYPPAPVYPPPNGYGYGYPTQQYVPPPMYQQGGYGYGYSGQVGPRRGNGAGMGTAMGVGAGLLGGFMLGEMVGDIGGGGDMF